MMLTEKQLIGKVRKLRQIRPRKDWVCLTKREILGEEPGFTFSLYFKPAMAGFLAIFVFFGAMGYGLVKSSLPGDLLYAVRKAVHQGQAVFIPDSQKPAFQLRLANDRLEDLATAPAGNLAPTISEFQANIAEAVRDLADIKATTSDPLAIKKIVEQTKKLEENKQKVQSLGVVIGEEGINELDNALKRVAENLIEDLKERTLSDEQKDILVQMEELFNRGDYFLALELYLIKQ